MNFKNLDIQIDFNDPERGFIFSTDGDPVKLSIVDWSNRKNTFRFYTTYIFTYRMAAEYKSYPEASAIEVIDSGLIESLRKDSTASPDEELHHYVISSNTAVQNQ